MSQLDLVWHEEPDVVRSGVVEAFVAYCGCGWREALTVRSRRDNQADAEAALAFHRERPCPLTAGVTPQPEGQQPGNRGAGSDT